MKNNTLITAALLSVVAVSSVNARPHPDHHEKAVKVVVKTDEAKSINHINIDGDSIDIEALKAFVENYKNSENAKNHKKDIKIIINDDESSTASHKTIKMVKHDEHHHSGKKDHENVEVFIERDGDEVTEKVIVNGKELTKDELLKFKSSGKMKVLHLDKGVKGQHQKKMVFINSGDQNNEVDIDVIVDQLSDLDNIDGKKVIVKTLNGHENHHHGKMKHVFKKQFSQKSDKGASLGFMTNVKKDGWHLVKIIDNSGAADAGIKVGDVIKTIADVDLSAVTGAENVNVEVLPQFDHGDIVDVIVERDGQTLEFNVEARDLDDSSFAFNWNHDGDDQEFFKWVDNSDDHELLSKIKVMVFDDDDYDFKLIEDDINMIFPKDLSDMNIFISDGSSTSKLLGNNHEMSSLSKGLSQYFHTSGGVLVLHVDKSNVFSLKDGDVIKSVNDHKVNSPKEVVKALVLAEDQKLIELSVVRNKISKKLKYQK